MTTRNRARARRGLDLLLRHERVEAALWRRHREQTQPETKQRLFEHYRAFAERIAANQFTRRKAGNFESGDVEQLAYEALIQAIERFDPGRGVPFEAFARIRINGHISNGLAQASESAAQYRYRMRAERERLRSIREGAKKEDGDAISTLSRLSAAIALGLMLESEVTNEVETLPDSTPSAYDSLALDEMRRQVHRTVDALPEREAYVIRQHYRHGVSFQQIAELLGVSKGRVSQIHRAALERLRSLLTKLR